jgi:hypothetical protein
MQHSITTLQAIEEFNTNCDHRITETLKDFYRGWLQSDLVDLLDGRERANYYYDFERLVELIETLRQNSEE